jgi:ABC-type transport system involved in multi-copper enzyme maturation permease subunit
MTTTEATATYTPPTGNVRFAGVVASEWTKLRSLRSTVWSLVAAVGMLVGFGLLFSWGVVSRWDRIGARERLTFDPTRISLGGVFLAQLAIGVLGVLLIGGEFSTGMIRSSLAAVPKRHPVLWGKAVVFGVIALVLMTVASVAAFEVAQVVLSGKGVQTTLGADGVLRAVLGAALFLTWVGLFGLALGTILRNSAAAISTLVGVLLVVPILMNFLPSDWRDHVDRWLPSSAGASLMDVHPTDAQLAPGVAGIMLIVYLVVAFSAAAVLLVRRDV